MRDKKIDCMKAILIILVVIAHSGFIYDKGIELFHMPVFFMVSGYLVTFHSDGSMNQFIRYTLKKVKTIWLPYFVWNVVYTVFNNLFIKLHIYSDIADVYLGKAVGEHVQMSWGEMVKNIVKGVFMLGRTELGGAFWFLRTLFYVSILFAGVEFVLKKVFKEERIRHIVRGTMAVLFLIMGYGANLLGITSIAIPVVLSSYFVYYLGYLIKHISFTRRINSLWAIVCVLVLLLAYQGPGISLGNNRYSTPIYLCICAVAGWVITYYMADIISKTRVATAMEYLGKHTLYIVIWHFFAFKLISLLQIMIYKYPIKYLAAFPVLNSSGGWWIIYSLIGVLIPLAVEFAWIKTKEALSCTK